MLIIMRAVWRVHHVAIDEHKAVARNHGQRVPFFPRGHVRCPVVAVAGDDDIRVGLDHRFNADSRRDNRQVGEHVAGAAQLQRAADEVVAVDRHQRVAPDLVKHRLRGFCAEAGAHPRQLLAQARRRRVHAGARAGQQRQLLDIFDDVVKIPRLGIIDREAQIDDFFPAIPGCRRFATRPRGRAQARSPLPD